jgi:hypothetical protein
MKINKPQNKKTLMIIAAVAVVILVGLGASAYFNKWWPFTSSNSSTINTAPATKDQQEAGQKVKQTNADQDADNSKPSGSDQPSAPVTQPNGKSTVTVSITAANQNGATLQIRSLIEAVNSDGTCTLTLSRAGYSSVTKTANVQPLASSSTCQGFDIPTAELSKGSWNVRLVFESSSLKGEASRTVEIQ